MKVYHYSPQTGVLLGSSDARPDPLEHAKGNKIFLTPGFATQIEPPEVLDGKQAVFQNGAWTLIDAAPAPTPPPAPDPWTAVRGRRGALLDASDWRMVSDAPTTDVDRISWMTYRQALRDITKTFTDPAAVVWPTAPRT